MLIELLAAITVIIFILGLFAVVTEGSYQHQKRFLKNNSLSYKYVEISFKHFQELYIVNPSAWTFIKDNQTLCYKDEFEVCFYHYYELCKYKRWIKKKVYARGELRRQKNQAQFINLVQKDIDNYRETMLKDLSKEVNDI